MRVARSLQRQGFIQDGAFKDFDCCCKVDISYNMKLKTDPSRNTSQLCSPMAWLKVPFTLPTLLDDLGKRAEAR